MRRRPWPARISSVVHVDGTARCQVVEREIIPVYHDILPASTAKSGLPVLINTCFNVHEEPIINTSEECAQRRWPRGASTT